MAKKITSGQLYELNNIALRSNSNIDTMFGASEIKKLVDDKDVIQENVATWNGMIYDFSGDELNNKMSHLENPIIKK